MVNSRNIAAFILALVPVAGCSSDHPIPPLDVGSSSRLLGMMPHDSRLVEGGTQSQSAYPSTNVGRTRLPPASVGNGSTMASSGGGYASPSYNNSPSYEAPRYEPAHGGAGTVYASSSDVSLDERQGGGTLDSQAARLEPSLAPVRASAEPVQSEPLEAPQVAAVGPASIALAEVSGVGVNAAEPLANRFGQQAKARGLSFTTATDANATHVMKGYFSVGSENGRSVVTYVWDISDRNGKRLHRISGNQPGGGTGQGWDGVTPAAMQAIADHSIDETARFLGAQAG